MNRLLIDEEFNALRDVVFADVSHVVIPPKSVLEAYRSFTEGYVENFGENCVETAWSIVGDARKNVAQLLNAEESGIAFVKNTAEGMGIISNGYPFSTGDKIIVCDQEHPSNLFPWIHLKERKGIILDVVKSASDMDLSEEEYIRRIDDSTKAVVLSSTQFTTGVRIDLEKIGDECRKRGVLLIVDAIQGIGRHLLDVKKMNISWLACGSNKGLLSMLGCGFIYCDPTLIKKIIPPYAGYQSVENTAPPPAMIDDFDRIHWKDDAKRFEAGNLNYAGIAAINAGVKLLNTLGIADIEAHILDLEKNILKKLSHLDLNFRTPIHNIKHHSGIICMYYKQEYEEKVKTILCKYKIYATFRGGYIRLGLNFYNKAEHVDLIVKALEEIAAL